MSPVQMFTTGALHQPVEQVTVLQNNFSVNESFSNQEDDINRENERPIFGEPTFVLTDRCLTELRSHCPVDWCSINFGIDVYDRAVQIITSNTQIIS